MENSRKLRVYVSKSQTLETFLRAIGIASFNINRIKVGDKPELSNLTQESMKGVYLHSGDFVNIYLEKSVCVDYCPRSV